MEYSFWICFSINRNKTLGICYDIAIQMIFLVPELRGNVQQKTRAATEGSLFISSVLNVVKTVNTLINIR